jgi:hypothetical protein
MEQNKFLTQKSVFRAQRTKNSAPTHALSLYGDANLLSSLNISASFAANLRHQTHVSQ